MLPKKPIQENDLYWMQQAYQMALLAYEEKEIPVGAIVVANDRIIAKGYNQTEKLQDVTAHAEMIALTSAFVHLGSKYLQGCTLYVTLEPCVMCAGALAWSQISRVVFGAKDEHRGFLKWGNLLHPKTELIGGIMETECSKLLKKFFAQLRN